MQTGGAMWHAQHFYGVLLSLKYILFGNWTPSFTIIFMEKTEKLGQKDRACLNPKDYTMDRLGIVKKGRKKANAIVLPVNRQCVTCFRAPL